MKFRISHNAIRDVEIVEVLGDDGALLATISPHQRGLHVVSKYLTGVEQPSSRHPVVAALAPSALVVLETDR
jgi:hypothetical protein